MTNEELDWGWLLDEKEISRRRSAAEHQFRDLGQGDIAYLRRRAKSDLFFLATGPLEYDLLSTGLHGNYCRWLERTRRYQYRVELLPRNHYKSTINTISESIQMALPNDDGIVPEYPWNLGPNIKLLLAHENRESASRFLYEITQAFTAKPLMMALFPELIPTPRIQRMNKWELELPRSSHSKEPTFDTIGAGGAAQGRHYNHLKLDDLVGEDARDSETVMRRTNNWFDNVNALLTRPKFEGWDLTGTHWAFDDTYSHALDVYGVDKEVSVMSAYAGRDIDKIPDGPMAVYLRGIVENGKPIFPEEFDLDFINRLRKNPIVYAAQYANNPRESGLTEFEPRWLRFYNVTGQWIYVFAGEDTWKVNVWDLDRAILIDPSMGENKDSDDSGIIVTGTDRKLNVYVLETVKRRLKPPELIDEMFRLWTKWNPRVMSVEEVAFSAIYRYWFYEKCKTLGVYPSVHPYKPPSQKSKRARIRGLSHYFAAGQIFIAEGMHDLRDEYEKFPLSHSEHLLDALAQGPEIWMPGLQAKDRDRLQTLEQKLQDEREALTGY